MKLVLNTEAQTLTLDGQKLAKPHITIKSEWIEGRPWHNKIIELVSEGYISGDKDKNLTRVEVRIQLIRM